MCVPKTKMYIFFFVMGLVKILTSDPRRASRKKKKSLLLSSAWVNQPSLSVSGACRVSSGGVSRAMLRTHARVRRTAWLTAPAGIAASTAGCRSVWPWACHVTVSPCPVQQAPEGEQSLHRYRTSNACKIPSRAACKVNVQPDSQCFSGTTLIATNRVKEEHIMKTFELTMFKNASQDASVIY